MSDSDAFHWTPPGQGLPFAIKVLILFFALDSLERVAELVHWAWFRPELKGISVSGFETNPYTASLWILLHLLLVFLLLMRTRWGRIWTQAILAIHLLYISQPLVLTRPEIWIYLDDMGRARLLFSFVFDLVALGYLFSAQARQHLKR